MAQQAGYVLMPGETVGDSCDECSLLLAPADCPLSKSEFTEGENSKEFVLVAETNGKGFKEHMLMGFAGMFEMPYKGGKSSGVLGFAAGLGLGVVGLASHAIKGA
jgi:hypothetical protein